MYIMILFLLLAQALSIPLEIGTQQVWCVHEKENICNHHCDKIFNVSTSANLTFTNVDNVVLLFCSPHITFDGVSVSLMDSVNLTITTLDATEITCLRSSGFFMYNLTNLVIATISLKGCGSGFPLFHSNNNVSACLFIENSFNVTLRNISIGRSEGSALMMLSSGGIILLENCTFWNNLHHMTVKKAGAVFIAFSTCSWKYFEKMSQFFNCTPFTITNASVTISESRFTDNFCSNGVVGGGLSIVVMNSSSSINVTISNSLFKNNTAKLGGGLHIVIKQMSQNNHIAIERSTFIANKTPKKTGGAVNVAHISYSESEVPIDNTVMFSDCNFTGNQAKFGGGLTVYSSSSPLNGDTRNSVQFINCVWIDNTASIGDAVDIGTYNKETNTTPYNLISIKFTNSSFASTADRSSTHLSVGVVFVQQYIIDFEGTTVFDNVIGSSLYILSATVKFGSNSVVQFSNNDARSGGSLHIVGQSKITIEDDSCFTFSNNSACRGAAILQHSINPHELIFSESCFIEYVGSKNVENRKISFTFENNTGDCDCVGNSVHVTTLLPCNYTDTKHGTECTPTFESNDSIFSCIANFSFSGEKEVSTKVKSLLAHETSILAMPGREIELPVQLQDELRNNVSDIYWPQLYKVIGDIRIDDAYTFITNHHIKLYGKPGSTATLLLSYQDLMTELNVTLQHCSPGYVIQMNNHASMCICSLAANPDGRFKCIVSCDDDNRIAILETNYWLGYDNASSITKYDSITSTLVYGFCPRGCCSTEDSTVALTNSAGFPKDLNDRVCSTNRRGTLCSQCTDNYTTHYHSGSFYCGSKKSCRYGWLLYIVSELIPVMLLFLIINVFDIKLTGGGINGFIYFAQTVNVVNVRTKYSGFAGTSLQLHRSIVGIFNLDFFQHHRLSFCLIENAQMLDLLVFRYVTIFYSLLLVLLLMTITRMCHGGRIRKFLGKIRSSSTQAMNRGTLIHGITGFLVLSYSECISVSIKLLLPITLYSKGHRRVRLAVWYNGELTHFRGKHLYYAIPSVLILCTFGLIPPLLLISYPLCYKVLAVLKLNESRFSHFICKCIPLEKMKPLFDSFQSSFKSRYRFFSGLYFIFRLAILSIQGISDNTPNYYTGVQITSAVIFSLHVLCQPYKKKWHNILEGLFLLDIALLAMTFTATQPSSIIIAIQILLLYFPIVFMGLYLGQILWLAARNYIICHRKRMESIEYHQFTDSSIFMAAETRNVHNDSLSL